MSKSMVKKKRLMTTMNISSHQKHRRGQRSYTMTETELQFEIECHVATIPWNYVLILTAYIISVNSVAFHSIHKSNTNFLLVCCYQRSSLRHLSFSNC